MNTITFLLMATGFFCLAGCERQEENILEPPGVEQYIGQLKSGDYPSDRLPLFSPENIPLLLQFRNETMKISGFPGNPISSLIMQECPLGVYVLWTIESIRAKSIGSTSMVLGFPSQNPVLALRNAGELELVTDDNSHEAAAKAYYNWWYGNVGKSFDTFSYTDPLAATNYRWH